MTKVGGISGGQNRRLAMAHAYLKHHESPFLRGCPISVGSHDLVLLGAAVLVLAGFAAALGKSALALRAVLDTHGRFLLFA